MAKLNAKVSSERASRTVSKSGDEFIKIELYVKNKHIKTLLLFTSLDSDENGTAWSIEDITKGDSDGKEKILFQGYS